MFYVPFQLSVFCPRRWIRVSYSFQAGLALSAKARYLIDKVSHLEKMLVNRSLFQNHIFDCNSAYEY